jgi:chromosome segregation ATPase
MKEKERISNLEELMAESLMRLDRLDDGQQRLEGRLGSLEGKIGSLEGKIGSLEGKIGSLDGRMGSLEDNMLRLSENQFQLNDRQSTLQESMIVLTQVVRKNSTDIEEIKDNMSTKEGLNNLFEAMMNGFDRVDKRFDFMQGEIDILKSMVK